MHSKKYTLLISSRLTDLKSSGIRAGNTSGGESGEREIQKIRNMYL